MSRDWLAVYSAVLHLPKYRRLTAPGKASLLHVWLLATNRSPEAYWPCRAALADELDLDGLDPSTVDELVRLRWLDLEDDGGLAVHDWDEHQFSASKAIRDRWEADRKKQWRRKAKSLPPGPTISTGSTATAGQDKTVQGVRTPSGPRPDALSPEDQERELERLNGLAYAAEQRRASKSVGMAS